MNWLDVAIAVILAATPDGGSMEHHHGHHGNPEDLDAYIAKMEEPSRAEWQKPDEVVKALALSPGQSVCDIGSGPGYFALRIAHAVGDNGQVFAVDVEPQILDVLRHRIESTGLHNITPVFALPYDSLVPDHACDVVLIVDTFHHFPDGADYLKRLTLKLKKGGRIVNIDFHKKDLPVGPPIEHKIAKEDFVKLAASAGLKVTKEETFLPYQYFVVLAPK